VETIGDLLYHLPRRYEDRRFVVPIASLSPGVPAVVRGAVENFTERDARNNKKLRVATFVISDASASARAVLFGGPRSFSDLRDGASLFLYGTPSLTCDDLIEFTNPEYSACGGGKSPPWLRLWPVYPGARGVPSSWLANKIQSCVASPEIEMDEALPPEIIEKYSFPSLRDALAGIHSPKGFEDIEAARARLAYQDFFDAQKKIAARERERTRVAAKAMGDGESLAARLVAGLPFRLTDAQERAAREISADMDGEVPMHRLLIGDVGSGKTAVAAMAAARCVGAGHQAAVLVPTTILADQFFAFCEKYLAPIGARVAKISGGMRQSERDELLWRVRDGETDVLVGTHAMLSDGVAFKSLGLLVIDEQQRFGVAQRDRVSAGNRGVHVLMTSATPIPRTMRMALYGDVAYTQMASRPDKGRVVTRLMSDNHIGDLYKFLSNRIARSGERCYWVCPRIGDGADDGDPSVASRAADIRRAMSGVCVEMMTGAMSGDEKSAAMARFASRPGILVSTTVIEVGVDVPGANVMIIESASSYGLSQLHQIRGRVGRGGRDGICVLLDTAKNLSGSKRLEILLDCDDGFKIAEADLLQRGAGEYLGYRQHGGENFRVADVARDEKWFLAAREDAERYIA
jgi:ATP-dependent DNA helicase RecG